MIPDFNDPDAVLATVRASAGRRMVGLVSLGVLGFFLIYLAFSSSPGLGWQVFLLTLGVLALWMAGRMRKATASMIELTPKLLRDSDGTILAHVDQIERIDRGVFAFKPSNGFLVRTRPGTGVETVWRPGLWWRFGRRIGVGGMTPGNQAKYMAELISALITEHRQDE